MSEMKRRLEKEGEKFEKLVNYHAKRESELSKSSQECFNRQSQLTSTYTQQITELQNELTAKADPSKYTTEINSLKERIEKLTLQLDRAEKGYQQISK